MKLAIIDVDTSHPENWIPIERDLGHEIVCIYDGGSVHPAAYVEKFAADMKVPRVCKTLAETAALADGAIIHGCDWDTHIAKAEPFVQAGKAVLLDKPVAGNLRELRKIRDWAASGARVTGGSTLRFCHEAADYLARPIEERGTPHTVFCGCAVDEFNYGIHAYAMMFAIMGPGVKSVRHLARGAQRRIQVNWPDGRMGFLVIDKADNWMPFYATVVTEKTIQHIIGGSDGLVLYRDGLKAMLPFLAGAAPAPLSPDAFIEPELCALAARQSWMNGDREVALADLDPNDKGYNGRTFADGYRKAKYP